MPPFYRVDPTNYIHQGAIYTFRPVSWLNPPLKIIRNKRSGRHVEYADIYPASEVYDAFRIRDTAYQEEIVALAKVRPMVVVSKRPDRGSSVLVAPFHTVEKLTPEMGSRIRENGYDSTFYVPADNDFPETKESYIDMKKIHAIHKDFLTDEHKYTHCLTEQALNILLERIRKMYK
ncbi:MAG: hypothetical protein GWP17_00790 [Aquificales bacterium]|nr:hypothetical protein [Aquificales bacterium]